MKRVCYDFVLVVAVLVVVLMVSKEASVAEAACNPADLMPCLAAVTSPAKPTDLCCSKLQSQKQCLCGYLKDPSYRHLIDSRVAQKFSSVCGITIPKC